MREHHRRRHRCCGGADVMRVLVACEESGVVRDAFTVRGYEAMSCDLLPTRSPGPHYQGDVRDVLDCALCATMKSWNTHKSPTSPHTAFLDVDLLNLDGAPAISTTGSKSRMFGGECGTTNDQMAITVSIFEMAMGNPEGHTFTYSSPSYLSAKNRSPMRACGTSTATPATMMQATLRGELRLKMNTTSEGMGHGSQDSLASSQRLNAVIFAREPKMENHNERLRKNTGSAVQLLHVWSIDRRGRRI